MGFFHKAPKLELIEGRTYKDGHGQIVTIKAKVNNPNYAFIGVLTENRVQMHRFYEKDGKSTTNDWFSRDDLVEGPTERYEMTESGRLKKISTGHASVGFPFPIGPHNLAPNVKPLS